MLMQVAPSKPVVGDKIDITKLNNSVCKWKKIEVQIYILLKIGKWLLISYDYFEKWGGF